jgi:hypothetical protein
MPKKPEPSSPKKTLTPKAAKEPEEASPESRVNKENIVEAFLALAVTLEDDRDEEWEDTVARTCRQPGRWSLATAVRSSLTGRRAYRARCSHKRIWRCGRTDATVDRSNRPVTGRHCGARGGHTRAAPAPGPRPPQQQQHGAHAVTVALVAVH